MTLQAKDHEHEYDSRMATLFHSQRVGELMVELIKEMLDRSTCHDRSKTESPEVEVFDEFTPKLKDSTYGSEEYSALRDSMGEGLRHHYAHNSHHPEFYPDGINGMTLVDLAEMLADWKASTERHDDGDLARSLEISKERFGISDQLAEILWSTARQFRWLTRSCGDKWTARDGTQMTCNVLIDRPEGHEGPHADGMFDGGVLTWD